MCPMENKFKNEEDITKIYQEVIIPKRKEG